MQHQIEVWPFDGHDVQRVGCLGSVACDDYPDGQRILDAAKELGLAHGFRHLHTYVVCDGVVGDLRIFRF